MRQSKVLLHAKFIRPFVQTNKTDAADARAIWTAVQQPGMRTVAAKTEDQQAMLGLHRMRSLLIKFRTMQVKPAASPEDLATRAVPSPRRTSLSPRRTLLLWITSQNTTRYPRSKFT
ncbi:transposase [Paraburkholderia sp. WSM4175]